VKVLGACLALHQHGNGTSQQGQAQWSGRFNAFEPNLLS
jgi:hypothetical protein